MKRENYNLVQVTLIVESIPLFSCQLTTILCQRRERKSLRERKRDGSFANPTNSETKKPMHSQQHNNKQMIIIKSAAQKIFKSKL